MTKRPVILAPIMVTTGLTNPETPAKSPREQGSAPQQKNRPGKRGGAQYRFTMIEWKRTSFYA